MKGLVFLIGFMGVGKTTIGKRLAAHLDVKFIDTDQLLEQQFQCSIAEFFERNGEEVFRIKEHELIISLTQQVNNAVISVGGGLPCFYDNMEIMNKSGITLYLHRPAKELFQRLKQGKHKRPLLANKSDEELIAFIMDTLAQRETYYLQAHHKLNREEQDVQSIAALLRKRRQ
jgi:shikimate kinase